LSGNPEDLLRGALEKIVYFECRLAQLESELRAARDVAAREKDGAAVAREREVAAAAALSAARSALETAQARDAELADRVRLLEAERERFLTGLIDQARIAGAPGRHGEVAGGDAGDAADLAGFIAELRGEVEALRAWRAAGLAAGLSVEPAPAAPAPDAAPPAVPEIARRFQDSGRIGLSRGDVSRLERALPSRAERSLYEASMEDLASSDPRDRRRAAAALRATASRAAAPLVAAAVGRERDPEVKVALLSALGAIGEASAADIAARELSDTRPAVRAAALEALAALAGPAAEPRLVAGTGDVSALVRRRAVMLLGFARGAASEEALASALSDRDPGVARAAALALSGRPTASAQGALARAVDHRQEGVRRVASEAVARWSGETVAASATAEERRRAARRIADRLSALDTGALREAVVAGAPAAAWPVMASASAPRDGAAGLLAAGGAARAPAHAVAVVTAAPAPGDRSPLEEAVLFEIRAALRGRTPVEIARLVPGDAVGALHSLVARGAVVLRGARYFPA